MLFTKRLREGVRQGRIRCSVRIWARPHVKVGGRYQMDEGQIVVDSVVSIGRKDITRELALESGFSSVQELLQIAKHGSGDNIYLIRFHYLAPGAWDVQSDRGALDEEGRGERPQSPSSPELHTTGANPRQRSAGSTSGGGQRDAFRRCPPRSRPAPRPGAKPLGRGEGLTHARKTNSAATTAGIV